MFSSHKRVRTRIIIIHKSLRRFEEIRPNVLVIKVNLIVLEKMKKKKWYKFTISSFYLQILKIFENIIFLLDIHVKKIREITVINS